MFKKTKNLSNVKFVKKRGKGTLNFKKPFMKWKINLMLHLSKLFGTEAKFALTHVYCTLKQKLIFEIGQKNLKKEK